MSSKLLVFLLLLTFGFARGQDEHCLSQIRQNKLLAAHPEYARHRERIEAFTRAWIKENTPKVKSNAAYQIPVVVHVVWHEEEENISDEQIQSQIEALNRDFQALNADLDLVPPAFRNFIADTELSFCLARTDPKSAPTSGITRTPTDYADIGTAQDDQGRFRVFYAESGGFDAWDPERYLNIWVARRGYGAGLASFPGATPPEEDGLMIDYRFFGTTGTAGNPPYNLGRTVTHEAGHYFNLLHPWGRDSQPDCEGDDEVEDTPRQADTYLRECPKGQPVSCDSPDFFFNYMNYTDDACMAMFTLGQKMRMLAALNGPRAGLLQQELCEEVNTPVRTAAETPVRIWIDATDRAVWIELPDRASGPVKFHFFNILGQQLRRGEIWVDGKEKLSLAEFSPGAYALYFQWQGRGYVETAILP